MNTKEKKLNYLESLNDDINKKYLAFLNYNDRLITNNLRVAGTLTREVSSNGLWCCTILPAVLTFYNCSCDVSLTYSIVTYTSMGLLFYSLLFMAFLTVSSLVIYEQVFGGSIACSLVSAVLLYSFKLKDLSASLMFTLPPVLAYSNLLRMSLAKFPKTFTVGEAMIICQSIVLYVVMTAARLYEDVDNGQFDIITAVVSTEFSTVGIIVTALSLMSDEQRNFTNLYRLVIVAAVFATLMLTSLLGLNWIKLLVVFVFRTVLHVRLFIFWLAIVFVAVVVILMRTNLAVKADTVTRKTFHVLASTVFLSGIVCDEELMLLAAGFGLGLLICVEALRKSRIEPFSSALQSAFLVYSDEKDSGSFAMTPFYLYCGLACPLLLVPQHRGSHLELLAGVLSIGVGDTAASWFGSRYGFNKWINSSKSVEGTVFNILSQVMTVYTLQIFSLLDARNALLRTAVAATASSLVEALTVQVDNLVLPIISLLAFQLTWPLR